MRRSRKILLAVFTLIVASIAFASWYRVKFSMHPARQFEVNDARATPRVLVATQGSEFKDAVVGVVVDHLKTRAAYVKVIDVVALPGVDEREWSAIVVLHTWEMGKPPKAAKDFVERARGSGKLVVLTTSGAGEFKMDGVDAISSASVVAEAPFRASDVVKKLDAILDALRQ